MMNNVQGDCRCGSLGFASGEDLTLATGKLAKLNADRHVVLPTAAADITPYVITCGADQGYLCGVTPLNSLSNSRVILKGTCQSGQLLVAAGDGRVEAGTLSGTAVPVGVAEEDGVEGQHVLLRPLSVGARGAAGAAGAAGVPGANGAPGAAGTAGAAGADGGVFCLPVAGVTGVPANPADLVGAALAMDGGYAWYGNAGQPVMGAQAFATVKGYADGVFECVLLSVAGVAGQTAVVPEACVGTGMDALAPGQTCGLTGWHDNMLWVAVDGGTMYYATQYRILAVGGGKVLLVSVEA